MSDNQRLNIPFITLVASFPLTLNANIIVAMNNAACHHDQLNCISIFPVFRYNLPEGRFT
ncbi:hypothetical protein U1E44_08350 [Arenibacter sp. GZD96]|uniref:hypothetical protein n=1 Tax=Aurantibrevibacter litoralis TaxID=3106030 RepID=UPI002AFDF6FF|nr:hypothetical protein [Arenibacter sp. GZD-96]MEA1786098.1 hypothetical protein [Arenibacter sp. GZD-96]